MDSGTPGIEGQARYPLLLPTVTDTGTLVAGSETVGTEGFSPLSRTPPFVIIGFYD